MKLFRLIALMSLGAFLGAVVIGDFLLYSKFGYDHGMGEGPRCDFAGAIIGAFAGLAFDRFLCFTQRPNWRFTTREMLVAVTVAAMALAGAIALVRWATTWQNPV